MAKISNAFTTYDAQANREEISDLIANIDPSATPFMSALGTKNVNNTTFDWQTETYQLLVQPENLKVLK